MIYPYHEQYTANPGDDAYGITPGAQYNILCIDRNDTVQYTVFTLAGTAYLTSDLKRIAYVKE